MGNRSSENRYLPESLFIIYRKIRYLRKRGTLFHKKASPTLFIPVQYEPDYFYERIYRIFRKLRFLISTGKLFKRKQLVKTEPQVENTRLAYRKIRYLVRRRSTWKYFTLLGKRYMRRNFGFLTFSNYNFILINSTAMFLLAYLFVHLLTQLGIVLAASNFKIDTVIYYYEIDFLIRAREWTPDAVQVVYTTGPFIGAIIAFLSFILYTNIIEELWVSRLFILWVFCHAFVRFFGEFLAGNLLGEGFGYVVMYMFFMDTSKMILTVFAFIIMMFTGLAMTRQFLFTGNLYFNLLDKSNRMSFVKAQYLFPFLIGTLIIIAVELPKVSALEICVLGSMALVLIPTVLRTRFMQDIYYEEEPKKVKIFWKAVAWTIVLFFLFRVIFGIGIRL
ncbi:MAG: hypothetical protein NTX61_08430 [Bacteroidetes bacterium]|nr:hypothetical protein [Bacteroidota bacterium]